jgi:hypothetical protein
MLLNYFRRKDAEDKGCFLLEPQEGGELPKEVVKSANSSVDLKLQEYWTF